MRHPFVQAYAYMLTRLPAVVASAPFSPASRSRVKRIAQAMGWPGLSQVLPAIDLDTLIGEHAPAIRVSQRTDHAFNTSFYELFAISQLTAARRPRNVFEFGTFNGRTTLHLAMNSPEHTQIHTIDLPNARDNFQDDSRVGQCFADTPWAGRIIQLLGNTRDFDFTAYHGTMELIFIDAGHDLASARHDTEVALKLAHPDGALILWHDYTQWPGVQQAVDEAAASDPRMRRVRRLRGTSMAVLDTMNQRTATPAPTGALTDATADRHPRHGPGAQQA